VPEILSVVNMSHQSVTMHSLKRWDKINLASSSRFFFYGMESLSISLGKNFDGRALVSETIWGSSQMSEVSCHVKSVF
jgi:hypothetical protein